MNTFIPTGDAGTETFIEYGVAYDKDGKITVPRSSWKFDPAEAAADRLLREKVHASDGRLEYLGVLRLVKRTVTYTASEWEDVALDQVDGEADSVRESSASPTAEGAEEA